MEIIMTLLRTEYDKFVDISRIECVFLHFYKDCDLWDVVVITYSGKEIIIKSFEDRTKACHYLLEFIDFLKQNDVDVNNYDKLL
jgi:hypothetical protein